MGNACAPMASNGTISPYESISKDFNGNVETDDGHSTESPKHFDEIDEGLYSRQLYVLGRDAMVKMMSSNILISGMTGLGAEVAKNIILGGVKSVTLHDTEIVSFADLSSHFYLTEMEIGINRGAACQPKLAELNGNVIVRFTDQPIDEELIIEHSVVVVCSAPLSEQLRISDLTRANNVSLIVADTRGLFGQIFNDFGDAFNVTDHNGEEPLSKPIESITQAEDGVVVWCSGDAGHGFEDGDVVTFKEVQGLSELNSSLRKIEVSGPHSFKIKNFSSDTDDVAGGIVSQVKIPHLLHFLPLREALENTDDQFMVTDFAKLDRPAQLHLAFLTMHAFDEKYRRLPGSWDSDDADIFVKMMDGVNERQPNQIEINEPLARLFSKLCRGNLSPMAGIIGGIVAQEVMKACSGKFMPIKQFMYFDALECLPDDDSGLTEDSCQPTGSRYDGQVAVFGSDLQKVFSEFSLFVIGAGAIGCEVLKNLAMMGLGTQSQGKIYLTDPDLIERSNLNRQFLFRHSDLKKPKSLVASKAVEGMNPEVNIESHLMEVSEKSEDFYNDSFFEGINCVVTALDSVTARNYVDSMCVHYEKPFVDSGTLGPKGSVQVILPHLTESYRSSNDPTETLIPLCTIKNFPHQFDHTVTWARDWLEETFINIPKAILIYKTSFSTADVQTKSEISDLDELFRSIAKAPSSFRDCVLWARKKWQFLFHDEIVDLVKTYPKDEVTDDGRPYWIGTKRFPTELNFDIKNPLHVDFIVAAANLRAFNFQLPQSRDRNQVKQILKSVQIQPDTPVGSDFFQELRGHFQSTEGTKNRLDVVPIIFEKDDDTNFHVDLILAASNLRATIYNIPRGDRATTKLIAGKIVPAIATTTSVIAGLACLELYKIMQGFKSLEAYKNGFINLALPLMAFSSPLQPKETMFRDKSYTLWSRIVLDCSEKEMNIKELSEYFMDNYNVSLNTIMYGFQILYQSETAEKDNQKAELTVSEILRKSGKILNNVSSIELDFICDNSDDEIADLPLVKYILPKNI